MDCGPPDSICPWNPPGENTGMGCCHPYGHCQWLRRAHIQQEDESLVENKAIQVTPEHFCVSPAGLWVFPPHPAPDLFSYWSL